MATVRKILFPPRFTPTRPYMLVEKHEPKATHGRQYDFERSKIVLKNQPDGNPEISSADLVVSLSDGGFSAAEITRILNGSMPSARDVDLITAARVRSKSIKYGYPTKSDLHRSPFFWWRHMTPPPPQGRPKLK